MKLPINKLKRRDVENFAQRQSREGSDLAGYQIIATKSAIYPGKGTPFGLMYAALGLGEAGEVQNKVKKAFRDDGVLSINEVGGGHATVEFFPTPEERKAQIIKELGGALWYIAATCEELGVSLADVALANLEELCGRGERGTLQGDGDDR